MPTPLSSKFDAKNPERKTNILSLAYQDPRVDAYIRGPHLLGHTEYGAIPSADDLAKTIESFIKADGDTGEHEVETVEGKRVSAHEWEEVWKQSPLLDIIYKSRAYKELSLKGVAGAVGVLNRTAFLAAFPAANWREYVTVLYTDVLPVKFTVRKQPFAYPVTSSGAAVQVTGPQQAQTTVNANVYKAQAEWDLEFAEDMPFAELAVSTMEIGEAIAVGEALDGLTALHNIAAANLGSSNLPAGQITSNEVTVTGLDATKIITRMRTGIRMNNRRPTFCEMSEESLGAYLETPRAVDRTLLYPDTVDFQRGLVGEFLGLTLYSSQLNTNVATNPSKPMVGDRRFIVQVVRRDLTLTPYQEKGVFGVWGAMRSGPGVLENGAFARATGDFVVGSSSAAP